MPTTAGSQALTASQTGFNPLSNWTYRYLPYDAMVRIGVQATTVGCRHYLKAGATEIVEQRSQVSGGGTAGVLPAPLNVPYIEFIGKAGDQIIWLIDEVLAGTPTVNWFIAIDPI